MHRSTALRVSLVSVASALLQLAPGSVLWAAPVTVDLTRQLSYVCDIPFADERACPRDRTVVDFSITYDPDTLVVTDPPIGDHLETSGPLTYTFSIPALDIPWGGPVEHFASASLTQLAPDIRELRLNITDQSSQPGVGFWRTRFLLTSILDGPSGPLTPADFEATLREPWRLGFTFFFSFQTLLVSGPDNVYAPGSRVYTGNRVPEPATVPLLAVALATFEAWRRRRPRPAPRPA